MPPVDAHRAALALLARDHGLISVDLAATVADDADSRGVDAVTHAIDTGNLDEFATIAAIGAELGFTVVDLDAATTPLVIDPTLMATADADVLRRRMAIPMRLEADTDAVVVVLANPTDIDTADWATRTFPGSRTVAAPPSQVARRLTVHMTGADLDGDPAGDTAAEAAAPADLVVSSPLVGWVDQTLEAAVAEGASDVHVEIKQGGHLQVRYRIDGVLHERPSGPRGREREIIGVLLAKSPQVDVANTFVPQDGSFKVTVGRDVVDVRLVAIPTDAGPKVVLRLLRRSAINVDLASLGHSDLVRAALLAAVRQPQGMVLVSGPTGSGKTSTLYALLKEVATPDRNVMTVEDPVEYRLPAASQIPIRKVRDPDRQLTFAKALRAILRADPDVILVGEIRDVETAKTAMEASITGHMVLSTIHTRNAVEVYTRLVQMGAPAHQVAQAITMAVAQRLVRRLHDCATTRPPTPDDTELFTYLGLDGRVESVGVPVGCRGCSDTGYKGRTAVTELVRPGRRMRALLARDRPDDEVREALSDPDTLWVPFGADAARLIATGATDPTEVVRVLSGAL